MSRSMRHGGAWLAALLGALLAPSAAGALSFSVPTGATIVDIDSSGSAQDLSYDGAAETLNVVAGVTAFVLELEDGSSDTIELAEGQVRFSMNIALDGTVTSRSGSLEATLRNGSNADFTVWDLGDDGDTSDDLLFAANFVDGLAMDAEELLFGLSGSLGESRYRVAGSQAPAEFQDALPTGGSLFASVEQFQQNGSGVSEICDIVDAPCPDPQSPGLQSFSAQPGVDLTPVPAPGSALLLGAGLLGLARGTRRPRR